MYKPLKVNLEFNLEINLEFQCSLTSKNKYLTQRRFFKASELVLAYTKNSQTEIVRGDSNLNYSGGLLWCSDCKSVSEVHC